MAFLTALQPPEGPVESVARGGLVCTPGDDVIKRHRDVGAELRLDFDGALGSKHPAAAVHVALEFDARFVDTAKALE